ncbi:helix-turn-helix transcriptional regulator [Komagataeibacter europaeus]|uniref:helix-turn-helix transcriptional regulator n=1 Tax=Komagataeibacter europaeus TaxID=33995 RepID=UPI000B3E99D9|nr:helix-turn-helix transcriptional regulator [Komagataeibacter europaeus]ARW16426.1 hypothetical protein S101446_01295 [Komagataeibacter europaeus]
MAKKLQNNNTIGNQIRAARRALSMGQAELAAALDVSVPTISEWENNKKLPSVERWNLIAKTLNVSVDQIFKQNMHTVFVGDIKTGTYPLTSRTILEIIEMYVKTVGRIEGHIEGRCKIVDDLTTKILKMDDINEIKEAVKFYSIIFPIKDNPIIQDVHELYNKFEHIMHTGMVPDEDNSTDNGKEEK